MADTIRVGAGCLNQIPMDWAGNRRRILQCISDAREAHVTVLCLPELDRPLHKTRALAFPVGGPRR